MSGSTTCVRCLLVLACAVAAVSRSVLAMDLVRDGQPVAEIVLAEPASPAEKFAVEDFRHWVKQITGATLPLLNAPSDAENVKVHVGRVLAAGWPDDLHALQGTDGFAIRSRERNVHIFGDVPRGTAYGLYRLLESSTDLIFARPAEAFGTIHGQQRTLTLGLTDMLSKPVFKLRGWNVTGVRGDRPTGIWVWRNGGNYAELTKTPELEFITMMPGDHTFFGLMAPPQQREQPEGPTLFERHPEYYNFDQTRGGRFPATLCLTNPDLPALCARNIVARAKTFSPPPVHVRLGMRDTWLMCKCEECQKAIVLADGSLLAMKSPSAEADPLFHSTQYFRFMNKVVAETLKLDPDLRIFVLSYFYAAQPPAVELHPAIMPLFCPIGGKNPRYPLDHPDQSPQWRERFSDWKRRAGNRMAMYEYYFGVHEPLVCFGMTGTTVAPDLRALAEVGAQGVLPELMPDSERRFRITLNRVWDAGGIDAWIMSRLFWDPYQDVTVLRDQYLQRTYREAAGAMKVFYNLLEQGWQTATAVPKNRGEAFRMLVVVPNLEAGCNAALEQAMKDVVHPHSRTMLERLRAEWLDFSQSLSRNHVPLITADEAAAVGEDFAAGQWDQGLVLDDFRRMRCWDWGAVRPAVASTQVSVLQDGVHLYVRTEARHPEPAKAVVMPRGEHDTWPAGDHLELFLKTKAGLHLFAFDGQANQYEARDFNRSWNADWKLHTLTTPGGWQSIAVIPLAALGYGPQEAEDGIAVSLVRVAVTQDRREETSLGGAMIIEREPVRLILD